MNARTLLNNPVFKWFQFTISNVYIQFTFKTYKTSKVFNTNI